MAGRIPPEFIDELLARTDIVDLVGSRVPLRRAGKEFQACCPFHNEKTPSFTVSPEKQFYHCFGCGAHGSAIGFLMEYDRRSFHEAVEELAHQAGMQVPGGQPVREGPDPGPLYALLEEVAGLYRRQLGRPEARRALDYLRDRGVAGDTAAAFGLGYAPPGWDFLQKTLGPGARERLVACGLLIERDGKRYDRFRDRIMFPIRDRRGRVVAFGGRLLGNQPGVEAPKYLNSPETAVFHKGRELYGLHEAQRADRRPARLLVVEGYMDVIALAQHGITYAVATLGTATSGEHVKLLMRAAPELLFCFDGDRAGRAAAWKALEATLPLATGRQQVGFLFLPEGEDPDSLVRREGRAGFEERLGAAIPLSAFLFDQLATQVDLSSLEGRARLATLAKPLLDRVPAGPYRDMLGEHLAGLVGLARHRLDPHRRASPPTVRRREEPRRRPPKEWLAVALILQDPRLARVVPETADDWKCLEKPAIALLSELVERIAAYPEITTSQLVHRLANQVPDAYLARLTDPRLIADIPEEGREADLKGALEALNQEARGAELERLCGQKDLSQLDEDGKRRLRKLLSPDPGGNPDHL